MCGHVAYLHIASRAANTARSVPSVRALAGIGLEGDRYARGLGHYSGDIKVSRDLTLVEGEVLDELAAELDIRLEPGETRRNVTTRHVALNALVGQHFWIGNVLCKGTSLCEPCQYLVDLVHKSILRPLVHRGGLRAEILCDGEIRVGDSIRLAEPQQIVIGTLNRSKARQCQLALAAGGIAGRPIWDLLPDPFEVPEDGGHATENARRKARAYQEHVRATVLSLDFALFFEGMAEEIQPGVRVRRIPGFTEAPTDEEVLAYYAGLLKRHGGSACGRWEAGVAVATPGGAVREVTVTISRTFIAKPSRARLPGYPLASLQLTADGRYIADLGAETLAYPELAEPMCQLAAGALSA